MYGLICLALLVLRRSDPDWYDPTFRMPEAPVLPAIGGLASFALIGFMDPASIIVGGGIMVAAFVWDWYYAADVELKGDL